MRVWTTGGYWTSQGELRKMKISFSFQYCDWVTRKRGGLTQNVSIYQEALEYRRNSFSIFTWMRFALFQLSCVEIYSLGVVPLRAVLNVISAMGTTEGQYGHLWTMLDMEKVIWYFCENWIWLAFHNIVFFFPGLSNLTVVGWHQQAAKHHTAAHLHPTKWDGGVNRKSKSEETHGPR